MPKKHKTLLCLSIPAVFLIFYFFNDGETRLTSKMKASHASKANKRKMPVNLTDNDNMVAAILIMPKSYLPALQQFSNSAMAKDIIILRAKLESKDGQMTAVYRTKEKRPGRKITPADNTPSKTNDTVLEQTPERKKRILAAGLVYFLAIMHKRRLLR
jgi:hypothetical protein